MISYNHLKRSTVFVTFPDNDIRDWNPLSVNYKIQNVSGFDGLRTKFN
jgi:hypothetical protein